MSASRTHQQHTSGQMYSGRRSSSSQSRSTEQLSTEPHGHEEDALGDPESVARNLVLRQLDARARTRAELERYLARKGVPEEPAARVLDRFTELRLIDDQALATAYVAARHSEQGLARRALAMKLRQRGIDDAIAAVALTEVSSDSEAEAARRLVERKLRSMSGLDPVVKTRRLVGLLGRKGYSSGVAYQVVREAMAAACDEL